MRQILFAGKKPQERPPLLRDVVANRTAQHRIARLERVKDRAQRGLTRDLDCHFAADVCQRSQMLREYYPDHAIHSHLPTSQMAFRIYPFGALNDDSNVFAESILLGRGHRPDRLEWHRDPRYDLNSLSIYQVGLEPHRANRPFGHV